MPILVSKTYAIVDEESADLGDFAQGNAIRGSFGRLTGVADMTTLTKQQQFFYDNAGYSYNPPTETQEEGHVRSAIRLANAEDWAKEEGMPFRWEVDPYIDSSDFSDEDPPWQLWECFAHDAEGRVLACLSGVDFGRDGSPWASPYRRVVEAELALEAMP